ncbi:MULTISPECIES: tRNA (guanosine(18)-2'-O)-methyltransferase TrmH [unclassified Agarivorans]|uniref:tRNA (guanosine(18)-2'-O)-methyltransferase TrmH n=1 Tax=unclassified Agarivorans TaxID=2636026 RepID=UPI0026E4488E|nr:MULTISPECIES: tRNA (guanosine(18)-2'-O)-methyltransferase TrmH [unclassified Agarivorans]MDO6685787.1 tRNA (guanosine(18)-2'-O)-methyltransferase TrmH [Agarivorans sp. 3_MG-2023]MDO6716098.1 tRNA (guanosine(18)-2'-O)-methyltransferase TrmH [Agarivorans sp. 2_MG-2023]
MTPERYQRIRAMLDARQTDLTICMENVHKPHNLSAIVRTCDAVGVDHVHAVWENYQDELRRGTATGSQNWVNVHNHENIDDAVAQMRNSGMQILATNLSESAVDFREIDYTKPTAILMGQEKYGISDKALSLADQDIIVPMVGMVQSLNVSVASALILYEAQRQRENAKMYQGPSSVPAEEQNRIMFEGGHPIFAEACRRKGLPIPQIDDEGQIVANDAWWAKMQMSKEAWDHLDDE